VQNAGSLPIKLQSAISPCCNGVVIVAVSVDWDPASGKVVIDDGCHRLSSVYSFDEDLEIPSKIACSPAELQ
jgi:hypothetical protein